MPQEKFNLQRVQSSFELSSAGNDDVFIDPYLEAFKELNKFLSMMGTVFGFIVNDIKVKVQILEKLRKQQDHGDQFETVQKMMDYELNSGLLNRSDYISGCRTFLRLHRGLNFIRVFLTRLCELETADESTCPICQASYNETLAEFQPWLIRKGALMAMYTLPNRDQLLEKISEDASTASRHLPEMLRAGHQVYDKTQALYYKYDLLRLP
ncbi:ceramide-1-phosphate transfer protein-like [Ochlerotatus camptorhynchus]|uniref:ceramide-1-phosphate transfer protein-like n=1 Tax=Ochlerotatus camptorhynchus TaxID=644619 RepID=UPI0031E3D119